MAKQKKRVQLVKAGTPAYSPGVTFVGPSQAVYMPKDYGAYIKEGYRRCPPLYRGVSVLAEAIAGVEWGLYEDRTLQKEITAHPLLDRLDAPNPYQGRGEFLETFAGYWLLSGNGYMYANRPGRGGEPLELWTLRPDQTRVAAGKYGPAGYVYGTGPDMTTYAPDEVMHLKTFSGNDPWYGLSLVEVAAGLIDQYNAALNWNVALMQNMARPSGAWVTKTVLNKTDYDRLRRELKEKYAGARNAGVPAVLDGGLEWQNMSLTPAEADWLNTMRFDAEQVATVLGLAPEIIGSGNRTYSNMGEAREAMYEDKALPLLDRFQDKLNMWLVPMYGGGVYLAYKKDKIEALRNRYEAARKTEADRATQAYNSTIITLNESRQAQGYKPVKGGDVFKINNILVPQEQLGEVAAKMADKATAAPPAPIMVHGPGAPGPAQGEGDAGQIGEDKLTQDGDPKDGKRAVKALNLQGQEQKSAYAQSVEQGREAWYGEVEGRVKSYFQAEHEAVKHAFTALSSHHAAGVDGYMDGLTQTVQAQAPALKRLIKGVYMDVGGAFGSSVAAQLAQGRKARRLKSSTAPDLAGAPEDNEAIDFDLLRPEVVAYLDELSSKKVVGIDKTTLDALRMIIALKVEDGASIPDIAKEIDTLYLDEIIPNRSTVIARTETIGASNYGSQEAAKQAQAAGLELKKVWLATEDARTRPSHAEADGQKKDLDEPFEVGGAELMYPGDGAGPANEVIQCRCTEYYEEQENTPSLQVETPKGVSYNTSGTLVRTKRQAYREYTRLERA